MHFYPDSYGTLLEFNKCHEPEGAAQSKGGQFCSETPGETSAKARPKQEGQHGTVRVQSDGGAQAALRNMGITQRVEEIAQAMTSLLPGDWTVAVRGFGESVRFEFDGGVGGASITRTFSVDDNGDLHVHHDYYAGAQSSEGTAKLLFAGSLPMYDQMGIKSISTSADIDIGAYAWARYGFVAESPMGLSETIAEKAEAFFKEPGLFSDADWARFTDLLAKDSNDHEFVWGIADLKFYTTPEIAQSLAHKWMTTQNVGTRPNGRKRPGTVFNEKVAEEAKQGIVSVGRILLADNAAGYPTSWSATLDLRNPDQVARLESYVGKWRSGEGAPRPAQRPIHEPPPDRIPEVPRKSSATVVGSALDRFVNDAHRGRERAKFDERYDDLSRRVRWSVPDRERVWRVVARTGVSLDKAVRSLRSQDTEAKMGRQIAAERRGRKMTPEQKASAARIAKIMRPRNLSST